MMMDKQFNLVGEGLIGRAAVIGNHQWILSKGESKDAHPPEVLKELSQQFSSGIQTISVIPVLPHGVVQCGSYLHILENMGVVEDVRTLISQLGCVPGVLLSDENAVKKPAPTTARPVYPGSSVSMESCGIAKVMNSSSMIASCNYSANSIQAERFIGQTSSLAGQIQECMQSSDSTFQASNITGRFAEFDDDHFLKKISPEVTSYMSTNSQLTTNVIKAEVIQPYPDVWTKQQAVLHIPKPRFREESSVGSLNLDSCNIRLTEQQISGENNLVKNNSTLPNGFRASQARIGDVLTSNFHENIVLPSTGVIELYKEVNMYQKSMPSPNFSLDAIRPPHKIIFCTESTGNGLHIGSSELKASSSYDVVNDAIKNHSLDGRDTQFLLDGSKRMVENDLFQAIALCRHGMSDQVQVSTFKMYMVKNMNMECDNAKYVDVCVQSQSGDDLFDVLGADFKNRLLNGSWSDDQSKGPDSNTKDCINNCSTSKISRHASSTVNQGNSDSGGMFSMTGFDHILETMVSNRTKPSLEDNLSCRTTLTNLSSSYSPNVSCFYGRVGFSSQIQGELYGPPKTLSKSGATSSDSFKYECSKENTGMHSQSCSIYGSQTSSWVESGHGTKLSSCVSTGYSKKSDEMSKTSRKRLKPGENPRPRTNDRQMIQDRVKELREIVPNGAKCSIDALLERTIKHMLFLQSVTKHADKLKQTGESKMLCEERGLFLEIADIIRGLGLTILKGVMEMRNDKIWPRFAVEAYRDVTRMDIFISLVRLLEHTAKGETEHANANDNNTAVVNSFHQVASILQLVVCCDQHLTTVSLANVKSKRQIMLAMTNIYT